MRRIVEYKLWGREIPFFIEDGGYFPKEGTFIGITKDDYNCYIPSDIIVLTSEDIKNRLLSMDYIKTNAASEEIIVTNEEKIIELTEWLNERGLK